MTTPEILLVEDNPYEAKLTIDSLQEHNLADKILHLDDGAEALDYLFARGIHKDTDPLLPKMILLDLKLPKINGLEVLRQIKANERTRSVPVVVLSSSKEYKDIKAAYEYGVNSYIVKPVEFDEFSKTVSDLGLYWVRLNQQ